MQFPCLKTGATFAVLILEIDLPAIRNWLNNVCRPNFSGLLQAIYAKVLKAYIPSLLLDVLGVMSKTVYLFL